MAILALADDATGALEVGAKFAHHGLPSGIWFWPEQPDTGDLTGSNGAVVDTESRHLAPAEAFARTYRSAPPGVDHLYKKTDSTLRGNIAAEFRALMTVYPSRPLVYVPAYPDMGRTVVGGQLLVGGLPLEETAFSKDPLNPATQHSIPMLLADCGVSVEVLSEPAQLPDALRRYSRGGVLVCDGTSNEDLAAVAVMLRGSPVRALAAGPAAFSGYWVRSFMPPAVEKTVWPRVRSCLVVNGSLHPASRAQVQWAADAGWPVYWWDGQDALPEVSCGWTIVSTVGARPGSPLEVARRLTHALRPQFDKQRFDALVIYGGDTLLGVLDAFGIRNVRACDEILPGVALALAGHGGRDLVLVTKAGGFGRPDTLESIRSVLETGQV